MGLFNENFNDKHEWRNTRRRATTCVSPLINNREWGPRPCLSDLSPRRHARWKKWRKVGRKNKSVERNWWVQFDERNSCFVRTSFIQAKFSNIEMNGLNTPATSEIFVEQERRNFGEKLFPWIVETSSFNFRDRKKCFPSPKNDESIFPFIECEKSQRICQRNILICERFSRSGTDKTRIEKEEKRKSVCDCTQLFTSRLRFAQEERYVSLSRRVSS